MHRFFISQLDHVDEKQVMLTGGQVLICSDDLLHQFIKVLRFASGEKIILLDNSGYEFLVELLSFDSKKIIGKVLEKKFCGTELPVKLVIALAILKNMERFEWVLQKGTELGVSAFIPLITDRTERKVLGKVERLHRILKEAAEQSGRGKVPELLETRGFEKVLENSDVREEKSLIIVPHPGVDAKISDLFKRVGKESGNISLPKEIVVCVGPEGGFTDREIQMVEDKSANSVGLGRRILRADTVPMVVSVLINQILGEL